METTNISTFPAVGVYLFRHRTVLLTILYRWPLSRSFFIAQLLTISHAPLYLQYIPCHYYVKYMAVIGVDNLHSVGS